MTSGGLLRPCRCRPVSGISSYACPLMLSFPSGAAMAPAQFPQVRTHNECLTVLTACGLIEGCAARPLTASHPSHRVAFILCLQHG